MIGGGRRGREKAQPQTADQKASRNAPGTADDLHQHVLALRRYALALTNDPNLVDDLVQETLRRALAYGGQTEKIRDLRAYLFTILHNLRVSEATHRQKWGVVVPITEQVPQLSCQPSQELRVECRELWDALYRISEEQREVLLLVAMEGHSYRATAEILDVPIGTVMSRLNRAREALRRMMNASPTGDQRRAVQ